MTKYYTLAERRNGTWSPQFGDHDHDTVTDELDAYREDPNAADAYLIITTATADAADIAAQITQLKNSRVSIEAIAAADAAAIGDQETLDTLAELALMDAADAALDAAKGAALTEYIAATDAAAADAALDAATADATAATAALTAALAALAAFKAAHPANLEQTR